MSTRKITLFKARSRYRGATPSIDLEIEAKEPLPYLGEDATNEQYKMIMEQDAERLLRAMKEALPGGTIDALFIRMAQDKAVYRGVSYNAAREDDSR